MRKVLNLVAAVGANPRASVDLLTHFAVALELATRRKKRPARFKKHAFSSYTDGSPVEAYEEGVPENAQSLLKKVLQTASQRGVVALAGVDLLPHDHAYADKARSRTLSRLVAAALAPAKGAWGARWRLDATFAAALPQEMNLGDPRAFALALVEHNDLEALCGSVEALVDDAERFGGLKAAWLAPYQVHVSKTVTMLCADFAARDPAHDCTAIATTVQFVAREA